jgi:hypothetical protein
MYILKIDFKHAITDAWGCNSIFSRNEQIPPHASLRGHFWQIFTIFLQFSGCGSARKRFPA